jgi:hypothetical protein
VSIINGVTVGVYDERSRLSGDQEIGEWGSGNQDISVRGSGEQYIRDWISGDKDIWGIFLTPQYPDLLSQIP